MKRFVLLVLLFVLPLQTLWAAGAGHCLELGGQADQALGPHEGTFGEAHAHNHAGKGEDPGHPTNSGVDCSAFHFVALEASGVAIHALPRIGATPFEAVNNFFKSHVPEGPDRPRWRFAV